MRRFLLVLFAFASTTGCMSGNSKEHLADALHQYNSAIRWGKPEWMIRYVADANKPELLPSSDVFEGDLRITDFKLGSVVFKTDEEAEATILLQWYRESRGHIHTSIVHQTWKRGGGHWRIMAQHRLKGAPLPWLVQSSLRALN